MAHIKKTSALPKCVSSAPVPVQVQVVMCMRIRRNQDLSPGSGSVAAVTVVACRPPLSVVYRSFMSLATGWATLAPLLLAPLLAGAPAGWCPDWCHRWACDGSAWCSNGQRPAPCHACPTRHKVKRGGDSDVSTSGSVDLGVDSRLVLPLSESYACHRATPPRIHRRWPSPSHAKH